MSVRLSRFFAAEQGLSVAKAGKVLASCGKMPNLQHLSFDPFGFSQRPIKRLSVNGGVSSRQGALLHAIQHIKMWLACEESVRSVKTVFPAHRLDPSSNLNHGVAQAVALVSGMQAAHAAWLPAPCAWVMY